MARYKREWFNPLYFHLRKYIEYPDLRKIMVYGGKSSAKTFSIAQLFSIMCYTEVVSAVCYRKEQTTIKTTLRNSFDKAIETTRMGAVWQPMDFKYRGVDNEIIFKGLDTEGKVKGIEGYKYLFFDELDHFTKEEWYQANLSLRGIKGQKLLASWNPIDENIWIKGEIDAQRWHDLPLSLGDNYSKLSDESFIRISEDGKTLLIKTNYLDNKWMVGGDGYGFRDQNLIDEYLSMKDKDPNSYNVNVLGEWGVRNKNKKFAWAFDRAKHVKDFVPAFIDVFGVPYNPNKIVWLSFDFNVNPITCTAMQHFDGAVFVFKCFRLENSNTVEMCNHIKSYFQKGTVFKVTGDSTGANRSTLSSDNLHNYQIIQRELKLLDSQIIVPTRNPDIQVNQVLLNSLLLNYVWMFQPGKEYADYAIYDLTYVEVDENKKIKKDRTSAERESDFLDTIRYFANVEFSNYLK